MEVRPRLRTFVIDTRMTDCNKSRYDEALAHLRLSRVLPVDMSREFKPTSDSRNWAASLLRHAIRVFSQDKDT